MTPQQAIDTMNELVKGVMSMGGFKDFESLDKCRQAIAVLLPLVAEKGEKK